MGKHTLADLQHLIPFHIDTPDLPALPLDDDGMLDLIPLLSRDDKDRVYEAKHMDMLMGVLREAEHLHRTSRHTHHYGKQVMLLTAVFRVWAYACVTRGDYRAMVSDPSPTSLMSRLRRLIDVPESTDNLFN